MGLKVQGLRGCCYGESRRRLLHVGHHVNGGHGLRSKEVLRVLLLAEHGATAAAGVGVAAAVDHVLLLLGFVDLAFLRGHVGGVGAGVRETLAAVVATKGFVTRVNSNMLLEKKIMQIQYNKNIPLIITPFYEVGY